MTRHFFRFVMIDGSAVELMTTVTTDADKVFKGNWTTGASTYFSPWMSPMVPDRYGDPIPDEGRLKRVNLPHVVSIEYWKREP